MMPSRYRSNWRWTEEMRHDLRWDFIGSDFEIYNCSQAWQDIFVLTVLEGLQGGTFLEIGGHVPLDNSNTHLLQQGFDWDGASIELDAQHFPLWKQLRPSSRFIIADALRLNYSKALPHWFGATHHRVDYLQLDIDPAFNTLEVLKKLPLDSWRFSVITFETDAYRGDFQPRDESRRILSERGYTLVAKDVCVIFPPVSPSPIPFEDWWVDPTVVRPDLIETLISINNHSSWPQDLLFAR